MPSWTRGWPPKPSRRRARHAHTVGSVQEKLFSAHGQPTSFRSMSCSSWLSLFLGIWPRLCSSMAADAANFVADRPARCAQTSPGPSARWLPDAPSPADSRRQARHIDRGNSAPWRSVPDICPFREKGPAAPDRLAQAAASDRQRSPSRRRHGPVEPVSPDGERNCARLLHLRRNGRGISLPG